ncbi:hypothetical protein [Xylanibacter rarus]|uniref:Uncharacterized protein n=1 Tax=Xylanibacter rarus TaxID=1676614 RepID=A0A8E1UPR5_9BACT|nr:hypothetical protein [Xylanibacter rarus]KOO67050.1 hypothetical protein ACU52_13315 [Xylanibacter rarus]
MHSKIFQITETKVAKDNYLNENTLEQGDGNYYDYCSEIDDNERKPHITNLVDNILPKGMFELVEADVIRYNGGADKWKEEFVAGINEMAKAITTDNCTWWVGAVYQLEKYLKNPLNTGYQFYMDEQGCSCHAEQSYEFLRTASQLEPGTLLYIGGVIDYHF